MAEVTGANAEGQERATTTAAVIDNASVEKIDPLADVLAEDWQQDIELKRYYAKWALRIMAAQVALADLLIIVYAVAERGHIDEKMLFAWLSATVIEVIGVTLAVTRGLFVRP